MPRPRRPPGFYLRSIHDRAADAARRRGYGNRVTWAVCPVCSGPMTPRYGRRGPYFHCRCPQPP